MIDFGIIKKVDSEIYDLILKEYERQNNELEMIASENRPSEAVLLAQASYHTLKYAEGYPEKRYYAGCENIDKTEQLAIDRACELFKSNYANVQPHSGASANTAVQFALCKPGDTIIGMSLNSGGHLTHGAKPTFSGKYFNIVQYEVNPGTYLIDYEEIRKMIFEHKPKLFIAGASAYPRKIEFDKIKEIIDDYNREVLQALDKMYPDDDTYAGHLDFSKKYEEQRCYFMVDMAHIAGLVAAGYHQNPVPYADVVTTTTHKTLRGPRGGLILTNDSEIIKKINKAVFPGIQGGPLENIIAAKAVCFKEALQPEFKEYVYNLLKNCEVLADTLRTYEVNMLTNGTDNHLILLDLRDKNITGQELEDRLKEIGIVSNKNAVPFDTRNKTTTSGLRIGTAAITSRGITDSKDIEQIGILIASCVNENSSVYSSYKEKYKEVVRDICNRYPLYKED